MKQIDSLEDLAIIMKYVEPSRLFIELSQPKQQCKINVSEKSISILAGFDEYVELPADCGLNNKETRLNSLYYGCMVYENNGCSQKDCAEYRNFVSNKEYLELIIDMFRTVLEGDISIDYKVKAGDKCVFLPCASIESAHLSNKKNWLEIAKSITDVYDTGVRIYISY